jgi:hypothetical protein
MHSMLKVAPESACSSYVLMIFRLYRFFTKTELYIMSVTSSVVITYG